MKAYFDNAATTPLDPRILKAMMPYFKQKFGNASSLHVWGQEARVAVEGARKVVAKVLNCEVEEVIFTGTTTTSDNLAIQGVVGAAQKRGKGDHIITSSVEHHAVLDTCKAMEKEDFRVAFLPVDKDGMVDPKNVKKAIEKDTVLVSIMYANNEVGTIQPIQQIGNLLKTYNKIYFHTDAAAAVDYSDLNVKKLGVDLMTIGAHKFGGPKGVGVLYAKKGVEIEPLTFGGHHERELWPGTEAVPLIVGMAKAIEIAAKEKKEALQKVSKLRDRLIKGVLNRVSDSWLTGHPTKRLADIASFVIKGVEGESLVLALSDKGIATSTGSACTSSSLSASHVLLAMGIKEEEAHGSLRISLGKDNTKEEVDYFLEVFPRLVKKLRKMSPKYY
jgi:cysteine desulfurase